MIRVGWYNYINYKSFTKNKKPLGEKGMNRKLIRPNFSDFKEKSNREAKKKSHPEFETHAENYYYLKQMNKKTPMAIVCMDGEKLEGHIEWYDRYCLKLNRPGVPNLLVYKNSIKYMYKIHSTKKRKEST
jgi:host factor-I protein